MSDLLKSSRDIQNRTFIEISQEFRDNYLNFLIKLFTGQFPPADFKKPQKVDLLKQTNLRYLDLRFFHYYNNILLLPVYAVEKLTRADSRVIHYRTFIKEFNKSSEEIKRNFIAPTSHLEINETVDQTLWAKVCDLVDYQGYRDMAKIDSSMESMIDLEDKDKQDTTTEKIEDENEEEEKEKEAERTCS